MASKDKTDSDTVIIKNIDMDQLILDTLGIEIKKQRTDAQSVLSYAFNAGLLVVIVLFITMAPEIAKRFTPEIYEEIKIRKAVINNEIESFNKKFSVEFKELSIVDFNELTEEEKIKDVNIEMNRITDLDKGPTTKLMVSKSIEKMGIDKEKITVAFTILPIIFVAMFAGSLFTYRFHMNIIKELYERRTKVLLTFYETRKNIEKQKIELETLKLKKIVEANTEAETLVEEHNATKKISTGTLNKVVSNISKNP